MVRMLLLLALVVLGCVLAALLRRLWLESRLLPAARAGCLDAATELLEDAHVTVTPSGFPRVAGRFRGRAVEIAVLPEALAFRKLPTLWSMVTLIEPQPLAGETRIMVRPSGTETFSTFSAMPAEAALPPGFPELAAARTDGHAALPSEEMLAELGPLFEDPNLKELVLSPRGLRLVRLVEEAPRGGYLLLRAGDLGRAPVPARILDEMLASLFGVSDALARTATPASAHA